MNDDDNNESTDKNKQTNKTRTVTNTTIAANKTTTLITVTTTTTPRYNQQNALTTVNRNLPYPTSHFSVCGHEWIFTMSNHFFFFLSSRETGE